MPNKKVAIDIAKGPFTLTESESECEKRSKSPQERSRCKRQTSRKFSLVLLLSVNGP